MLKKFLKKFSSKELVWYISCIIVIVVGLVFMILGIIGDHMPVTHFMRTMQGKFPWRYIGLIIIAFGVIVFITVLLVYGKKVDRVTDRETRRKQRLQAMMSDINDKQETLIINEQGHIESKKVETITADTDIKQSAIKNDDSSFDNAIIDEKKE